MMVCILPPFLFIFQNRYKCFKELQILAQQIHHHQMARINRLHQLLLQSHIHFLDLRLLLAHRRQAPPSASFLPIFFHK